jgi:hypothetical protein
MIADRIATARPVGVSEAPSPLAVTPPPMTDSTTATPSSTISARPRDGDAGPFPLPTRELERIAGEVVAVALQGGATAAETDVSQAIGLSVTVRKDAVETISYNRD